MRHRMMQTTVSNRIKENTFKRKKFVSFVSLLFHNVRFPKQLYLTFTKGCHTSASYNWRIANCQLNCSFISSSGQQKCNGKYRTKFYFQGNDQSQHLFLVCYL